MIPEVVTKQSLLDQVQSVLDKGDSEICFTFFGLPTSVVCSRIKLANYPLLIQVGSLTEARSATLLGADALILQGKEAGGHHLGSSSLDELLTHMQQLNLGLPLVAAGGIATGADFARVYALGADACMCGTLFIATEESAAHPLFKERVVGATASDTVVTDLFRIGWQSHVHRVLHNDVVDEGGKLPPTFIGKTTILGKVYWIPRFSVAVPTISTEGEIEQMAMYCGTSCNGVHAIRPTAEVIQQFRQESQAALKSSQRQFCIGNEEEG